MVARNHLWLSLLLLACIFIPASVHSAEPLRTVKLQGTEYVSLHQWARQKGLTVDWDKPNKTVQVSSKWTRMTFNVNSKKVTLNGLAIWLCSAVVVSRETLYVSQRDVYKSLDPILYPARQLKGVRTVAIAAGHGGKDPGNIVNREQEKKYTLLLAKALKEALMASGFKVIMTRETDTFIDLEPQAAIARRVKADLFISVHYNAVADIEPNGIETFSLTPAGAISTNGGTPSPRSPGNRNDSLNQLLAYQVHKSMLQNTGFQDRGVRRASFLVLRHLEMPGILLEGGFMSNPGDAKRIYSAAHRKTTARAIADGVLSYKRLVERN